MMGIPQSSIIRAWYAPLGGFLIEGFLNLNNEFFVLRNNALVPIPGVQIDFATGILAEDDTPVYQNDRIEYEAKNEFGSVQVKQGVVSYHPIGMRFAIDEIGKEVIEQPQIDLVMIKIIKVIGHAHD